MTEIEKKYQVITKDGTPMATNDRDERYLLTGSRAHALRVIRWLGLTGVKVRPATDEEVAGGKYAVAHETPDWSVEQMRQGGREGATAARWDS